MANDQYILDHYRNIAEQYGLAANSTLRDPFIRAVEVDFIFAQIYEFVSEHSRFPKILDLGCGNAHTLSLIQKYFPECKLHGLEFSPELYRLARKRNLMNTELFLGDMRKPLPALDVDVILTERSLINLLSRKQQMRAVLNIFNLLKHGGEYWMIESFNSSLNELNILMRQNSFEIVTPSKHNFFVRQGLITYMEKLGFKAKTSEVPANQLSTYFVLTRVFHPLLRRKGQKRINNKLIEFFVDGLTQHSGNFSPIQFHRFLKE